MSSFGIWIRLMTSDGPETMARDDIDMTAPLPVRDASSRTRAQRLHRRIGPSEWSDLGLRGSDGLTVCSICNVDTVGADRFESTPPDWLDGRMSQVLRRLERMLRPAMPLNIRQAIRL